MTCVRCAREVVGGPGKRELSDVVEDHVKQGWSVEIDENGIVEVACPEHVQHSLRVTRSRAARIESTFSVVVHRLGTDDEEFTCWCGERRTVPMLALSTFYVHARTCEKRPAGLVFGQWIKGAVSYPVLFTDDGLRLCPLEPEHP